MYEGKTHTLFIKYAVPQMIGLLFNSVYLIVDGIFIGNRLGRDAMAVASGAGITISNRLGCKKMDAARQTFGLAALILSVISITIAALSNIFIHPLATLLGSTPEIHGDAVTYLRYIISFAPFLLFSFLLGGLARNDGKPKLAMFALAFGSLSNIVLDYVFMYPLNMGIAGAALATALGPIFSVMILLPHFLMKKGNLYFTKFRPRIRSVKQILTLEFPSFIMEFTIGIITFVYNFAIIKNGYGELGLAAYLVIGYLMLIILTMFLGMAEGLQPVFSYFSGTRERQRGQALLSFSSDILSHLTPKGV